jgi:hypothetical protein
MLPKGRLRPIRIVKEVVQQEVVQHIPIRGPEGPIGIGLEGPQGPRGESGTIPAHRWVGDELQFQNPDGTWGKKRNLRGPSGGGSVAQHFKYFAVDTATYTVNVKQLVSGINIFGVRYDAGPVTITLPESINPNDKTLIFNDETGNAGTNNITVQVP